MKRSIFCLLLTCLISFSAVAEELRIDDLFPLQNYKKVIDTCMRVYSDLLILEEKAQRGERVEELVDIIVGRLVRMQSYVKQLIHDFHIEKTVSSDELEYLGQLLAYMEVAAHATTNDRFPILFNTWVQRLKDDLSKAVSVPEAT